MKRIKLNISKLIFDESRRINLLLSLFLVMVLLVPKLVFAGGGHDHGHSHDHEEEHNEENQKGPNGGRLLKEDDFEIEVTIFEDGVPPQYRLFVYNNKKPVAPDSVKVSITLDRPFRGKDTFELFSKDNYLTSNKTVEEPHSFKVEVKAEYQGKNYTWSYESFEGRTELSDEALKVANITIDKVAAQKINLTTEVFGRILPNEDRAAHIYPRFAGVIKEVKVKLGSNVNKGDLLAIIESNQSLQPYEIRALNQGVVVKRHASVGEFVPEDKELFVIVDLTDVWADFQVYRADFDEITVGQEITIKTESDQEPIIAKVDYVSPLTDIATQSKLVRVTLDNSKRNLRPGLFISGVLTSAALEAQIAVKREAVQTFRDWNVVFLTDGHVFQAMPVELGRQDQSYVEIKSGLKSSDNYVSKNSFILKADIEKSGASHDH